MQEYLIASEKNATLQTLSPMPWCSITLISRQMMHNGRMQVLQSRAVEVLLRLLKKEVILFLCGDSLSFSLIIYFLLSASILIANQVSGGRAKYMSRETKYTRVSRDSCILLDVLFFVEIRLLTDNVRFNDERNPKRFFLSLCYTDVTLGDVVNSSPYRNMVDAVELKGKDLLQLFELSASIFGTGGFLQVSGNF